MRERITFVHPPGGGIDPDDLEIQEAGLLGPQFEAARQDRLTFALDELPPELTDVLRGFDSVYVRWTSPLQLDTLDPFAARLSPGFHLSYAARPNTSSDPSTLCSALQSFGPLRCMSAEAFIEAPGSDSSSDPSFSYYQELEDLSSFIKAATKNYCPELDSICQARIRALLTAAGLDITYSVKSDALQVAAFWPIRPQNLAIPASSTRRTEVGIFVQDVPPHLQSHELGVTGLLTVLGEQTKPSPALFNFPSRHHETESTFTSKFLSPTGLHPTLQLSLSSSQPPREDDSCEPFAYLTLPKEIFADRYQLADELFLASKNLSASRYTSLPVDLEAPAYTTESWGSNVLLQLAPPKSDANEPWTAEVPLHLRYLKPSESGEVQVEVPYPALFWACSSGAELHKNPFDRIGLGYDGLFGPETVFWHITPRAASGNRLTNPVTVPVLKEEGAAWIGFGTTLVVALGFAWVLWKLAAVALKPSKLKPTTSKPVAKSQREQKE